MLTSRTWTAVWTQALLTLWGSVVAVCVTLWLFYEWNRLFEVVLLGIDSNVGLEDDCRRTTAAAPHWWSFKWTSQLLALCALLVTNLQNISSYLLIVTLQQFKVSFRERETLTSCLYLYNSVIAIPDAFDSTVLHWLLILVDAARMKTDRSKVCSFSLFRIIFSLNATFCFHWNWASFEWNLPQSCCQC